METTRAPSGDLRGLSGTSCVAAGTDFWFVGSGAEVGQRGRLYLTNPESAPAQVDVTLYGPAGEIDAPSGRGVSVAARGQEVLLLDALAPAIPRFGVHVQVRQGRIAAALRDQQIRGLDPLGVDWVPPAAAPSRRVVLAGVPAGSGERHLQVLAPGTADAIVRVRLLAADGAFVPAGLDLVEIPAGTVRDVDLATHARGEAVAVELTADAPITAGLLARVGTGREQPELAYAAANSPLTQAQPGVLALAAAGRQRRRAAPARRAARHGDRAGGADAARDGHAHDGERARGLPDRGRPARHQCGSDVRRHGGPAVGLGAGVRDASRCRRRDSRGPMLTLSTLLPGRYVVAVPQVSADLSTGLRSGPLRSAASRRAAGSRGRPSPAPARAARRPARRRRRARTRRGAAKPGCGPRPGVGRRPRGRGWPSLAGKVRPRGTGASAAAAAPSTGSGGTSSTTNSTARSDSAQVSSSASTASSTSSSKRSAGVTHRGLPGGARGPRSPRPRRSRCRCLTGPRLVERPARQTRDDAPWQIPGVVGGGR